MKKELSGLFAGQVSLGNFCCNFLQIPFRYTNKSSLCGQRGKLWSHFLRVLPLPELFYVGEFPRFRQLTCDCGRMVQR